MPDQPFSETALVRLLEAYPPFYFLPKVELDRLVTRVEVLELPAGDFLFEENQDFQGVVYVLQAGVVEIQKRYEAETQVIDTLRPGDLLGARSALSDRPFLGSARAQVDSRLLVIRGEDFLHLLEQYPRAALFFARGFAAGRPIIHAEGTGPAAAREEHFWSREPVVYMRTQDVLVPHPIEALLSGPPSTSLRSVALAMKERFFGSFIVVDEQRRPVGIVTESDFVRRGATRNVNWESPIEQIMSRPVATIGRGATAAELIVKMLENKIDHLVITEDGTDQTPVAGILSQRDILLMHGNNPGVLVRQLQEAADIDTLVRVRDRADELIYNYLRQEVSVTFVSEVITELNDTLIRRALDFARQRLAREGQADPGLSFCWLALGSEGRREQLRRSDQDNAILYEDPPPGGEDEAAAYFRSLGTYTVDILLRAGFARCPAEIMASNPKWVQPLAGWKQYFTDWIGLPSSEALLHASIFFDFRAVTGNGPLVRQLTDHVFGQIEGRSGFLNFFAQSALQHPAPLSFFRNFILDSEGDRKDVFDLKARAMRPLDHAARVLVYANDIRGVTNTGKRYAALAAKLPDGKLFEEASLAYEILMRYRAINGFRHGDSGRYLQPQLLNKIERETLKTCFTTVERVQQYLKNMFRVSG